MSWGNPKTLSEKALVRLLWPASAGLGTASYMRMMAYNTGILKQKHVPALVISVGNITCGGTGKTPVTIDLAQRLIARGRKVAVLSRGYKRLSKEDALIVSDGREIRVACSDAGDEPYLIAGAVPDAVVIVGAKRAQTAVMAAQRFQCDTIILDDAFQHFGVARDVDIVLIDYNDELENDHLLPAGRLREPLSALARAQYVVITKVPSEPDQAKLQRISSLVMKYAPHAELSSCRITSKNLHPFGCPDVTLGPATLHDTRVFAFCGIARPDLFLEQLRAMGAQIVGHKTFPDHHWYSHQDVATIERMYVQSGAEMVITTEKDGVKLVPALVKQLPLTVLRQKVEWMGPIPVVGRLQELVKGRI
jgi:tetraacyldisaccharide 4'-kinase